MAPRKFPNIIITGTPGVGKTTMSDQLIALTADTPHPLRALSITSLVKDKSCHEGYDEELQTYIVDEDRLLDEVEPILSGGGGYVIDWHVCDLFPQSWIDLVVVLRCEDTKVMFDRLQARGYNEKKLQENVDAEIFGVVAEEAREGFEEQVVVELESVGVEDVERNCERVAKWVEEWIKDHEHDGEEGEE